MNAIRILTIIFLIPTLSYASIRLPFRTQISEAGWQMILKAKSVQRFVESTEGETLKFIAIREKKRERTPITVAESHWDEAEGDATVFFREKRRESPTMAAVYLDQGLFPWNSGFSTIIGYQDIDLFQLVHEYMHHLIRSNPKNVVRSLLDHQKLSRKQIKALAQHWFDKAMLSKPEPGEHPSKSAQNEQCRDIIYMTATGFAHFKTTHLEEIEINQFLIEQNSSQAALDHLFSLFDEISWVENIIVHYNTLESKTVEVYRRNLTQGALAHCMVQLVRTPLWDDDQKTDLLAVISNLSDAIESTLQKLETVKPFIVGHISQNGYLKLAKGDLNLDRKIDERDIEILQRVIEQPTMELTSSEALFFDVNSDGNINGADIARIYENMEQEE
jgi:hypothetical protein